MPSVSIIVPIFNAAQWLPRCLDSILVQTLTDIEILLVNDGSTDESGRICDSYSQQDPRITVFHRPNSGVSLTRQFAVDQAKGDYLAFVDADDWAEPDMIESMYSTALCNNADIVLCDYFDERPEGQMLISQEPASTDCSALQRQFNQNLHGALWNKLIKRSLFSHYGVTFPSELQYGEDKYVIMKLLENQVKIAYVPSALYHFDQTGNQQSLTRAKIESVFLNRIRFYLLMQDEFKGDVRKDTSYTMIFYAYRMLSADFVGQSCYSQAFRGKRSYILSSKGRLYKRICVFLATYKAGWPVSILLFRAIELLSSIKNNIKVF